MLALGTLIACGLILFGFVLEGGNPLALFNLPALMIVFGATIGIGVAQSDRSRLSDLRFALQRLLSPYAPSFPETIDSLTRWGHLARKEGVLVLEKEANLQPDPFLQEGMLLLVDGVKSDGVQQHLEVAMTAEEERYLSGAEFFEQLAGYAPTMGILGAVLGLIQVLVDVADSESLGLGIATAFVAIVYGLALANLLFLPVASRLRWQAQRLYRHREMALAGLLAIQQGENPRHIAQRLRHFR
ncbi:MAG: MotA/TolQ/ExbB proton channel family protein [Natronospirillum sp.]